MAQKTASLSSKIILKTIISFLIVAMGIAAILPAATVQAASYRITAVFDSFTSTNSASFKFNGDAGVNVAESSIRLTSGTTNKYGTAWWNQKVSLSNQRSFSAYFTFKMGNGSGNPADGFTFAIQTLSNSAGSTGQGLGIGGVSPSFAVEFDTYNNTGSPTYDINANHIGIDVDGDTESIWSTNFDAVSLLSDGTLYHAWIDYDGSTDTLTILVGDSNDRSLATTYFNDQIFDHTSPQEHLYDIVGQDVYVGFTAATGAEYQEHHVKSFYFNNDYVSGGITPASNTYTAYPAIVDLTVSPASILADNSATSTVQVCTKDSSNNLLGNETVTLSTTAGTLTSTSLVTGAGTGCASTTIRGASIATATITATAQGGVTDSDTVSFTGWAPSGFSAENPPDGIKGSSYSYSFVATGGNPNTYTYVVSSGTLPAGLSLSTAGLLSGTPTTVGTSSGVVVRAYNAYGSAYTSSFDITVDKATPMVTIVSDTPDPSVYNQSYTVSFSVTSPHGTPTGTVTVSDGTGGSCNITDYNGGTRSCSLTSVSVGSKTLTVTYGGDSNFYGASGTTSHSVDKATPTVTITSDTPDPSVYGETYPVQVSVTSIYGTPSGTVSVSDGAGGSCGPVALVGGAASCDLTSLAVGPLTLTATYNGDANFNGSSGTTSHTVNQADTSVLLTSSHNPAPYGEPVTVTAVVTADSPSAASPVTGQVQFKLDGVDYGSPKTLAGGSATSDPLPTPLGTYSLTAVYLESTNFKSSTSNTVSQVVEQATTTTTIVSDDNPSIYGESVLFRATVAANLPSLAVPTGSVRFFINNTQYYDAVPLVNGVAEVLIDYTSIWPTVHTVKAVYDETTNFESSFGTVSQTVQKAVPTISITPSKSPIVTGEKINLEIAVSHYLPVNSKPSRTVSLLVDGVPYAGPLTLDANGKVTINNFSYTSGSHVFRVQYVGDDYYAATTSDLSDPVVINKANTTTSLTGFAPTTLVTGQATTVSVSVVSNSPGAGVPEGDVLVSNGVDSCTVTLVSGTGMGSCVLRPSAIGQPDLTATYQGSTFYNSSNSGNLAGPVVNQAETSVTSLTFNPATLIVGQSTLVTVTVAADSPGSYYPTGTVEITNGVDSCTVLSLVNGSGSCSFSPTAVGQPDLEAAYSGDANYLDSSAVFAGPNVTPSPTTTVVTSDANPSVYGQSVTFTAAVSVDAPGSGTPTGTVSFFVDNILLGTRELAGGTASITTADFLALGSRTVRAEYSGDANFLSDVSADFTQVVNSAEKTIVLESLRNPAPYGVSVSLEATVTAVAPSTAVPTGSVQFYVGGVTYGDPVALDENGVALKVLPYTALWPGAYNLTAVYIPDAEFAGTPDNNSNLVVQTIDRGETSITLTPNPEPSVLGLGVDFTVKIVSAGESTRPVTGNVQIWIDGVLFDSHTLVNGDGGQYQSISTSLLDVGSHDIEIVYAGDSAYAPHTQLFEDAHEVNKAESITTITDITPTSVYLTETFDVTVNVAAVSSAYTPLGTVLVNAGSDSCEIDLSLTNQCTITPSGVGTPDVVATYSGDGNFNGSSDSVEGPIVDYIPTISAVASSDSTSEWSQPVFFTATVQDLPARFGNPEGTVQFYVDDTPLGDPVALENGQAQSVSVVDLNLGDHEVFARYLNNGVFETSDSPTITQTITAATTTTTVGALTPIDYGQSVVVSATVAASGSGEATPEGYVQFSVDGVPYYEPVLLVNGVASKEIRFNVLWVQTHTITAHYNSSFSYDGQTYSPNPNFAASNSTSSPVQQVVNKATPVFSTTASLEPSVFGQSVTFQVQASNQNTLANKPTGSVQITIGGSLLGTFVLSNGTISTGAISSLGAGTPDMTIVYSGDENYDSGTYLLEDAHQVNQAGSLATIESFSPSTIEIGEPFTVTVQVAAVAPGSGTPTGSVEVDFGPDSCSISTLTNGSGSCQITPTALDGGNITAAYSGDNNFTADTAEPLAGPEVIQGVTNVTSLVFDPAGVVVGQSFDITVTVKRTLDNTDIASGVVVVTNGVDECEISLNNGSGSCAFTPSTAADPIRLVASYAGDTNFAPDSSSFDGPVVNPAETEIYELTINPESLVTGQSVTVTAKVRAKAPSTSTPTGEITIVLNHVSVGGGGLQSETPVVAAECTTELVSGIAQCDIPAPGAGDLFADVTFWGDSNFLGSMMEEYYTGIAVSKAATEVVLSGSSSSVYGVSASWTATVLPTGVGGGTPQGSVKFYINGVYEATVSLTDGQAELSTADLAVGDYVITAEYLESADYYGSESDGWNMQVTPAAFKLFLPVIRR